MGDGRVAFVTGGAGGIGSAICHALSESGHRVCVADLELERASTLATKLDGLGVELDVTDERSVVAGLERAASELGPIDVCVSCAGWDHFQPFLDSDDAFARKVVEINLTGPIRVVRNVLPSMVERRFGRVISIASDAGRVGSTLEAVYSGAKGGLIAFTKTIAREMARYGITANSVSPGPTDTPLLDTILDREDGRRVIQSIEKTIPLRRLGTPEDVAPAVAFLASDGAGFITGQTLSVSGGLTMA